MFRRDQEQGPATFEGLGLVSVGGEVPTLQYAPTTSGEGLVQ